MNKQTSVVVIFVLLLFLKATAFADGIDKNYLQLPLSQRIDTLLAISDYLISGNPDSSLLYSSAAIDLLKNTSDERVTSAYKLSADAWYYLNDFEKAINCYEASADAALKSFGRNSLEYASRINDVGYCYYVIGIYDMALSHYHNALEILEDIGAYDEYITTISNIGTVHFNNGSYEKAIKYYEETLEYDIAEGHNYEASVTENNIGKVYQAWGKHVPALAYFKNSLDYAVQTEDTALEAIRLSNLGMLYLDMGKSDMALSMLNRALYLDSLRNNELKVAIRKSELSRIFAGSKDYENAINLSCDALKFFKKAGISESVVIVYIDLGRYYKSLGEFEKSAENYKKGAREAVRITSNKMLMDAYNGLSELFQLYGDYKQAFMYQRQADSLNKLLFNEQSYKQLANFEIKYHTRETELENVLLKNEIEKRRIRVILLSIGVLSLIIIIGLLIRVNTLNRRSLKQQLQVAEYEKAEKERERAHYEDKVFAEKQINRLQREKYDTEIAHKNQLLVNSTVGLVQKNDVLSQLKEKVKSLPSDDHTKEIFELIRDNIDQDQNWKKFRVEFTSIHPRFFDNLTAKFPDLSDNNIQLCAYLRINLSSKEVANLMSISVSSVNKNRQRLRKKLQLEAETNLSEFLATLD